MPYIITGTLTYSSQTNRDSALSRINSALSSHVYSNIATTFAAGVNTSGTTVITISISAGDTSTVATDIFQAVYNAATQVNRHTSGYLSVNRI